MTDSFFAIGTNHRICQDYALHGKLKDGREYAIVSDGCSSAIDSDFGARILAKCSEIFIQKNISPCESYFFETLKWDAMRIVNSLNLPLESLCATLIIAIQDKGSVKVALRGDGCIVGKNKNGDLSVSSFQTEYNAPYYLKYDLNEEDRKKYFSMFNGNKLIVTDDTLDSNGVLRNSLKKILPVDSHIVYEFDSKDYEFVSIFSDGLFSFVESVQSATSKTTRTLPHEEILKEVLAFRGFNGDFVKRRCQMAWKKFAQNKWSNFDDFSMGVCQCPSSLPAAAQSSPSTTQDASPT